MGSRDPRVDDYLAPLPGWQYDVLTELRELIHDCDPEVTETIKRRVQPYFVLDGNACAFLAARNHVNLFLYDGAIVPDPDRIITGGHGNSTARMISFHESDAIPTGPLTEMLRRIIANNRAGGWRKIKDAQKH